MEKYVRSSQAAADPTDLHSRSASPSLSPALATRPPTVSCPAGLPCTTSRTPPSSRTTNTPACARTARPGKARSSCASTRSTAAPARRSGRRARPRPRPTPLRSPSRLRPRPRRSLKERCWRRCPAGGGPTRTRSTTRFARRSGRTPSRTEHPSLSQSMVSHFLR